MEKSLISEPSEYHCLFCEVLVPKSFISAHLKLCENHRISKLKHIPPPLEDFLKLIKNKIEAINTIQIKIQQSSISLTQSILMNTQLILTRLDEIIRLYKSILLEPAKKIQENEYISNFHVNSTLNTALTDHFQQKIFVDCWMFERKKKLITSKISEILENKCDCFFSMLISNSEEFIVTGGQSGFLRVWDLQNNIQSHCLKEHKGSVYALAISLDDSIMLSGSNDSTLRLWDMKTKQHLHNFEDHNNYITSVLISEDKKTGFSGDKDGSIKIWDLETKVLKKTISDHSYIFKISLYNKEKLIVIAEYEGLTFWDTNNEELTRVTEGSVTCLVFTKDERHFITGNFNGVIRIWLSRTRKVIFEDTEIHKHKIDKIEFTKCSKLFATWSSGSQNVHIWDFKKQKVVHTFDLINGIGTFCILKNSNLLAVCENDRPFISFYNLITNQITEKNIQPKRLFLQTIAISSDLKYMAYGCSSLNLYEIDARKKVKKMIHNKSECSCINFSPDNSHLGVGFDSGLIFVLSVPCLTPLYEFHFCNSVVDSMSFSMSNKFLACGYYSNELFVYEIEKNELAFYEESVFVLSSVFCHNDKRLVYCVSHKYIHVISKNFTKVAKLKLDLNIFRLMVSKIDGRVYVSDCQLFCYCIDAVTSEIKLTKEKRNGNVFDMEDSKLQIFLNLPRVSIS